ncbi:hypothetical protein FWF93_00425 [Candidatus Saccharibacteria bacterium]|nr:hypothetical protein [Candidatus Saccharibacteria bacterium]
MILSVITKIATGVILFGFCGWAFICAEGTFAIVLSAPFVVLSAVMLIGVILELPKSLNMSKILKKTELSDHSSVEKLEKTQKKLDSA